MHSDIFLTNSHAAELLGIAPTTLNQWRSNGRSPPYRV